MPRGNAPYVTRIASFDGLPDLGSLGFTARRARGSLSRVASGAALTAIERRVSGLDISASARTSSNATPWALSALGLGIGLAASVAVTSGLVNAANNAASTAAGALWRGSQRRRGVHINPAALHLHCTTARPPQAAEPVSVLIAMRHEPAPAVAAIRAALRQRGVDHLDIVVLDDGCPQETRTALRREFGDDPRVRILAAAPLPRGWSPRAHRYHQLAVAARGRVLIFAEPCAPLGPHAAAAATALLRGEQLDLAVLDTGRPAPKSADPQSAHGIDAQSAAPPRAESWQAEAQQARTPRAGDHGSVRDEANDEHTRVRPAAHSLHGHHRSSRAYGSSGTRLGLGLGTGAGRTHPGRFAVAVDADAYWRIGGYRAAATDPDPLALLRTVRRASGRVAVADGRRVIPPAQQLEPLLPPDPEAEAQWESQHSSRASLTGTARRVLAALVGSRP